jgi:hypothetical protein
VPTYQIFERLLRPRVRRVVEQLHGGVEADGRSEEVRIHGDEEKISTKYKVRKIKDIKIFDLDLIF